jgi:hypothetical protein
MAATGASIIISLTGLGATTTSPLAGCNLPARTVVRSIPAEVARQENVTEDCPLGRTTACVPEGVSTDRTRSLGLATGWFAAFLSITVELTVDPAFASIVGRSNARLAGAESNSLGID